MIKAIIFDFDGVILESADIKTEAFRQLFEPRFPKEVDQIVDYHKKNMGISRFVKFKHIYKTFAQKVLHREEETQLGDEFSKIVYDQVLETPMVTGADEFLRENHKKYSIFIASGTPEAELHDIVKRRHLTRYFLEVFGSPQEKEDIIKHIMKKYGFQKSEIIFVGDAESDFRAASATGVHFVAKIKKGSSDFAQCKNRISDLSQLNEAVNQLK